MKKFFKKVMSCAIALVLVAATAATFKAMPAKAASSTTIYFKNSSNWAHVYCYMYYGTGDNGPKWPGTEMTNLGNGWCSITYTGTDPIDPVFNDNDKNQTNNCTEIPAGTGAAYYWISGTSTNSMTHSTAYNVSVVTDDPVKAGYPNVTVYFKNVENWSNVYCYLFTGSKANGPEWPGTKMTSLGNGWYSFAYTGTDPINPVFNDNGSNQTNNCAEMATSNKQIFYVITGQSTNSMSKKLGYDLTIYTDPVKAGFKTNTVAPVSSSSSAASSSSSAAATSSASSVANPKTGNAAPIAAGSIVILAGAAFLGIALTKKKSK